MITIYYQGLRCRGRRDRAFVDRPIEVRLARSNSQDHKAAANPRENRANRDRALSGPKLEEIPLPLQRLDVRARQFRPQLLQLVDGVEDSLAIPLGLHLLEVKYRIAIEGHHPNFPHPCLRRGGLQSLPREQRQSLGPAASSGTAGDRLQLEATVEGVADAERVHLGGGGKRAVEELVDGLAPKHEPALEVLLAQPTGFLVQSGVGARRRRLCRTSRRAGSSPRTRRSSGCAPRGRDGRRR